MAETAEAAPKKSGNKKLFLLIGVGAVAVLAGGAALGFVLKGKGAEAVEKKAEPRKMPVFVDLDTFTVNLRDNDGERYLQVKLVAELKDPASGEMLKQLMPSVRNEILLLLGSKQAEQLATREGKEKLANEIVAATNKTLEGTPAAKSVEGVNFTHFIIQ